MKARHATAEDLQAWYAGDVPFSMRAAVLEDAGRVVAIGGIGWAPNHMQLFCHIADEARPHKVALGRLAALVRSMIRGPVVALQDCSEPTSTRLLQWCGLEEVEPGVWYGSGNPLRDHGRLNAVEHVVTAQAG